MTAIADPYEGSLRAAIAAADTKIEAFEDYRYLLAQAAGQAVDHVVQLGVATPTRCANNGN